MANKHETVMTETVAVERVQKRPENEGETTIITKIDLNLPCDEIVSNVTAAFGRLTDEEKKWLEWYRKDFLPLARLTEEEKEAFKDEFGVGDALDKDVFLDLTALDKALIAIEKELNEEQNGDKVSISDFIESGACFDEEEIKRVLDKEGIDPKTIDSSQIIDEIREGEERMQDIRKASGAQAVEGSLTEKISKDRAVAKVKTALLNLKHSGKLRGKGKKK